MVPIGPVPISAWGTVHRRLDQGPEALWHTSTARSNEQVPYGYGALLAHDDHDLNKYQ